MFAMWLAIQRRGPVCERWRSSGLSTAMFTRSRRGRHLLVRDDTSGAFSPGNGRWEVGRWYRSAAFDARIRQLVDAAAVKAISMVYRHSSSRSRRTAALSGFFALSHILDGPLR